MKRLTPVQERAVQSLLAEATIEAAARSAGVRESQLRDWIDSKAFFDAYRAARQDVFGRAYWMAQRYAPAAVQTMAKVMLDESAAGANRIAAAQAILRIAREGLDLENAERNAEANLSIAE